MFVALLLLACDERPGVSSAQSIAQVVPTPTPTPPQPVPVAAQPPEASVDRADRAGAAPGCPPGAETQGASGDKGWSAVGQAPRGADLSLSRQVASDRARKKLADLLKKQKILDDGAELPAGATVERIWSRGKNVFAEVRWCNTSDPSGLNEPPKRPSNSVEVGNPLKKPD